MPCNTPPPPELGDIQDGVEDDPDMLMYEVIDEDEMEELVRDDSIITFTGHKDSVFCCNMDKNGIFAVSGGQDDTAFVWNTHTGTTSFECAGHSESVIAADFNHDSKFVATADMNGLVQAWDVNSGNKVWSFEASEISWMEWHNSANILFAGTTDGNCWKWSIPDGEKCDLFQTYGSGSTCGKILPDGARCVMGYMDGSVRLWDNDGPSVIGSITGPAAHKKTVTCVECNSDNSLIVTGSEDGSAKLIKSSNCKVLWDIDCSNEGEENADESIESIDFFKSHPLVATGTNCGNLAIWDISAQVQRSTCNVKASIVKLICSSTSPLVYVATSDGVIELYDGRTAHLESKWMGHDFGILDFVLSRDSERLLSASDDHTCKVYKVT